MKIILSCIFVLNIAVFANTRVSNGEVNSSVPKWAKKAVWYQIFPERFNNGDPSNDPTPDDIKGGWPYLVPKGWKIIPWESDWYHFQPWEKMTGHDFYWNQGLRRYGGDIQGIIDKLDYLQNLGITAIYLNPVFESPSLHKYDTRMYRHIDNNFGPNPQKDKKIWQREKPDDAATWLWTSADTLFLKLIKEIHKRRMRIIIDGVFNHVGYTFWAFQDVRRKQQKSNFKEWFIIKSFDNPLTPGNEFDYEGWNGVRDLPEVREDENGLNLGFKKYLHKIILRWMDPDNDGDPSDGIDGWRLDVAEKVNIRFWREFRSWVKEINPDAYITAELWWQDWSRNKMYNAAPWFAGDTFDGVMNYRFARALKKFVADVKTQISASAFIDSLRSLYHDYPADNLAVSLNLLDSHDVDRISSQIVNPDRWYDHQASFQNNPKYDVRKPEGAEWLKLKLIVGLQMTLPGAPMIYYGDEAGMWGGDDPDCRKPMVWPNINYEPETTLPNGNSRPADSVKFNQKLFRWYQKMIKIRKNNPEFSEGSIKFIVKFGKDKILGFLRHYKNRNSMVLINNQSIQTSFPLTIPDKLAEKGYLFNLVNKQKLIFDGKNIIIHFSPYEILILK